MSPRKKTRLQRSKKDHPNKQNQKQYKKRIQKNAELLRVLEKADPVKKAE